MELKIIVQQHIRNTGSLILETRPSYCNFGGGKTQIKTKKLKKTSSSFNQSKKKKKQLKIRILD